jgi:GWxTD domain-containing protein
VVYIITDEEKSAFKRLQTDEERQQFVEQFWLRRDPTPDSIENEYKEEHYRRIAYASYVYASGIPGWKTDRGMIYITCGPPDEVESHPAVGGETPAHPSEQWRYRNARMNRDIVLEFIDTTASGEYHLKIGPSKMDPLFYVPNLSQGRIIPSPCSSAFTDEFARIERLDPQDSELWKIKDLMAVADSDVRYDTLPMQMRVDYLKVTDATDLCNISAAIDNSALQFTNRDGIAKAAVNLFGRFTLKSGRPVGWFEDTVEVSVPAERLQTSRAPLRFIKSIPLPPGAYRLNVVAKDPAAGTLNNAESFLDVPRYDEDHLGASSVILADVMQRQPTKGISAGTFVIGPSEVRPRLSETFQRGEEMGIYAEFYNLGMDEKTHKPDATIEYQVVNSRTNQGVFEMAEELGKMENASPSLVVVKKFLPLKQFEPGSYSIKMKVVDRQAKQTLTTPPAKFTVTS